MKGKFIVFEGGEGVGKTTVIKKVEEWLGSKNINFISTREPGGLKSAEDIRKVIMDNDLLASTEALLFAAARNEHTIKKIIPALEEGKVVLCDRYVLTSIIYQGILCGCGRDFVCDVNKICIYPDLTIILDADPYESIKRIKDNDREINKFDEMDINFHKKVRGVYLELGEQYLNHEVVDASGTKEEVFGKVTEVIEKYFNL